MKEYIMSFFNAPVTNKIPTCICSVAGLHTYISTNPQLEELTHKVRAGLGDKQAFRKNKQTLLPYVTPVNPEKPDVPLNKNDAFQKVQKRRVQEKR